MALELYLVQHGTTDWNLCRWSQGHSDVPINEDGRRQAASLAKRLADVRFDAIYSSDMQRTVESTRPLAEAQGLSVVADWRLREGRWSHQKPRGGVPVLPFPVASETHEDVLARVAGFLAEVRERHPDGRVMIMTHGAVLTRLVFHLEAEAVWPFPPFDMIKMALNVVRIENGVADATVFNGREHLTDEDMEATGHRRRRRRRRIIVHACGAFARRWLPESLHARASAFLRSQADRDKRLALNPYADLVVEEGAPRRPPEARAALALLAPGAA